MKRFLWFIVCCLLISTGYARQDGNAQEVLDKTAARLSPENGIKANFKADNFANGELQGSTSGTMCIQGEKFQMTTPEIVTWYNGETQWSYVKANEEVNVSTPTPEEKLNMNPYAVIHLYKNGYQYQMKETTLRGKACYEVTLKAQDGQKSLSTIIIDIDKRTYTPLCIRMRQKGNGHWTRITIHQFRSGQSFAASDFEFNAKDYPQAEIIDLR